MSSTPDSKVLDLTALADYQEGTIVSRQITKSETGNITLFAFDQGQELSEHTTAYDALVHVLEGQVEVRLAGEPYLLTGGQVILMPANVPHALRALSRFKMLLTMIRG